ncbi:hypothetical protein [Kaistia sp. MMO-174]|uniref:hypothetical protein n=1 Tax=Kaistia sp. MMO-174 TaxID=3081256 RepID=UPI003016CDC4
MDEQSLRFAIGMAAFSLPSLIVTFFIAWLSSLVLPKPRASWKHCLAAFLLAWIVVVLLSPWLELSYMVSGPLWKLYGFQLGAAFLLLGLLPRWRSGRSGDHTV